MIAECAEASYICPVCGYGGLLAPPRDYHICPCCGTEFDLDDFEVSHAELRVAWISEGCKWWSTRTEPPEGWDLKAQLACVGSGDGEECIPYGG